MFGPTTDTCSKGTTHTDSRWIWVARDGFWEMKTASYVGCDPYFLLHLQHCQNREIKPTMRISQLARTLKITQAEIIDFLSEKGLQNTNTGVHAKLDQGLVEAVIAHFKPESEANPEPEQDGQITGAEVAAETQLSDKDIAEASETEIEQIADKSMEQEPVEPAAGEEVEVVRAKKIKLPGIKVVGKIELPEAPVKQASDDSDEDSTRQDGHAVHHEKKSPGKRGDDYKKKRRSKKPTQAKHGGQAVLSYEERLVRQQRQEAKKQRELKKREKEKKRQKYLASIQGKQEMQNRKPSVSQQEKKPAAKPKHKNPVKRFFAWLNGEYDSF